MNQSHRIAAPFVVLAVKVAADGESVRLVGKDRAIELMLTGDCCSRSYFPEASLTDLRELKGEKLAMLEEVESARPDGVQPDEECGEDVRWHALKITTNKSSRTIDWRNDSNGYYDGWLTISEVTP